jgi:DNA primase
MPERAEIRTVAGQDFKVTTPGRVFYPVTSTDKDDVINYYLAVAGVMLPHLQGRPATRKRWPDGVGGPEFFAKDLELRHCRSSRRHRTSGWSVAPPVAVHSPSRGTARSTARLLHTFKQSGGDPR